MATRDVTVELNELCGLLEDGEMVKTKRFDLSRAISAVELFSPKMDAGMVGKRPQPETLDLRFKDLKDEEILAIVDRLWHYELVYYDGAPLPQSVFTCLYAHAANVNKAKEQNPVLYAFLIATLRACHRVHELVVSAEVCFEEDFSAGNAGIEFAGATLTDQEYSNVLIEATQKTSNDALISRLMFRHFLLEASIKLDEYKFSEAEAHILQAHNELARCKLGESTADVGFAFDPLVNYWRIVPQPPRTVAEYSLKLMRQGWLDTIDGLFHICSASRCVLQGNGKGELINLFDELCYFSRTPIAQQEGSKVKEWPGRVNALVRSRMAHALCDKEQRAFGVAPWKTLVAKDVALWGSDAVQGYNEESSTSLQAMHFLFEALRTLCFNPARQRRKLVRRIEDLGTFQQRCETIDAKILGIKNFNEMGPEEKQRWRGTFKLPLGNWSCEWCVRFMTRFLELGCELQLFRPREAKSICYILFCMHRLQTAFHEQSVVARNLKKEVESTSKNPFGFALIRRALLNEMKRTLNLGNLQLLIALTHAQGKEKDVEVVFNDPRMHFEHRFFDPFSTVWLPILFNYMDFSSAFLPEIATKRPVETMVEQANETYSKVKAIGQASLQRAEFKALPPLEGGKTEEKHLTLMRWRQREVEEYARNLVKCAIRNSLVCVGIKPFIAAKQTGFAYSTSYDLSLRDASFLSIQIPPGQAVVSANATKSESDQTPKAAKAAQ